MQLRDIIPYSAFAIIATVEGEQSLEKAEVFLGSNRELIGKFPMLLLHINSSLNVRLGIVDRYVELYRDTFPLISNGIEVLHGMINSVHYPNPGHMWGTIVLDEACLREATALGFKYIWKINEDMIITEALLDKEIGDNVDFLYLPGFSYEILLNAGCTANLMRDYESKFYAPQTTLFILKTNVVDSLYGDTRTRREVWEEGKALSGNPNLKPWEVAQPDGVKFGLEDLLGHTTKDLNKQMLISQESFHKLIDHVKYRAEGDPSHKNVMLKEIGVCHFHNYKNKVYEI